LSNPQHRRRFRNYLLDKSLQLRYVALVTALSALIAGGLGFLIWRQETYASDKVVAAFNASELADDDELKAEIVDRLDSGDSLLVLRMAGAGIGLMVVLSLYLIVMTHKVAGPLFKVGRYFDRMAEGRLGEVWPLRKGDMLVDFYETFQATHEALRRRHQEHNAAIARFLAACDGAAVGGGALGQALDELRAHHGTRAQSLT
jgi:hypothetical protein